MADQRILDRHAPQCDEEAGRRRRMGTEKIVRHWLVRREEVSPVTRKRARRSAGCTVVYHGEKSETRAQRDWVNGNTEQQRGRQTGHGQKRPHITSSERKELEEPLVSPKVGM